MKKTTLIITAAALAAALGAAMIVPKAVESSAPAAETVRAQTREYCETVSGGGSVAYMDQRSVTSSLPLVPESFSVKVGDEVNVGDEIATVDRTSSAALINSLGQVSALGIPASGIETAIAMIPEKITSNCSGRIISTAPAGSVVQSGSSIAEVSEGGELSVSAAVSELDIAKISLGQKAEITLAAYPDETFLGTVSEISDTARDQYNGAVLETVVDISVTPDSADERFKPGLSADVSVALGEPREICVVPYSAIGQDSSGEFVCVYEDGKAVRHNVSTGAEFEDGAEILSGVDKNSVIFKSPEDLSGKSYVKFKEPQ